MNQTSKILKLLKQRKSKGVFNTELNRICFRYGARIYELRQDGYSISCIRLKQGIYNYVLLGEPK